MPLSLLAWSLTLAALLHIFEEFVYPGGFKAWWSAYRPEIAASVTNRFVVIINVVLVLFSANVALAAQAPRGDGVAHARFRRRPSKSSRTLPAYGQAFHDSNLFSHRRAL